MFTIIADENILFQDDIDGALTHEVMCKKCGAFTPTTRKFTVFPSVLFIQVDMSTKNKNHGWGYSLAKILDGFYLLDDDDKQ